ncbi:MAG: cyclase family protein [Bacteroidota bacterium]
MGCFKNSSGFTLNLKLIIDLAKYRIIDLTLTYNQQVAGYQRELSKSIENDGWNASTLHLYSHAGTHMDAPLHFGIGTQTIDTFLPGQVMGKAWVAHTLIHEPQALLEIEDLGSIVDHFQAGDSLLIRTDWSKLIGQQQYRNELPRISEALAHWCVERQVKMLGVEPPSVADVNNLKEVTKIHQILLGGNVIIIEGLCNLDQLNQSEVMLIALPLKIHQGDGAPARVIALEEKT